MIAISPEMKVATTSNSLLARDNEGMREHNRLVQSPVKLLSMCSEYFAPGWQHDAILCRPRENMATVYIHCDQTSSDCQRTLRTGRKHREIFLARGRSGFHTVHRNSQRHVCGCYPSGGHTPAARGRRIRHLVCRK